MNEKGKIIFLIKDGEEGIYKTTPKLELDCSKYNIAHGRDITPSAAVSKVRVVLGKVGNRNGNGLFLGTEPDRTDQRAELQHQGGNDDS